MPTSQLTHREITVETGDGPMSCRIGIPATAARPPIVIVCHDGPGIRPAVHDAADRVAAAGYVAVLPDLYHRQGRWVAFDPMKLRQGDQDEQQRMLATVAATTVPAMVADVRAARAAVAAAFPVHQGSAGIVGFCHTARTVLAAMAAHPDEFAAGAAMHPSFVVTDGPDSPHRVAGSIRGPLYLGFGETDRAAPWDSQRPLLDELERGGVRAEVELHPRAGHGYAFAGTPAYDPVAAERSWEGVFRALRSVPGQA